MDTRTGCSVWDPFQFQRFWMDKGYMPSQIQGYQTRKLCWMNKGYNNAERVSIQHSSCFYGVKAPPNTRFLQPFGLWTEQRKKLIGFWISQDDYIRIYVGLTILRIKPASRTTYYNSHGMLLKSMVIQRDND